MRKKEQRHLFDSLFVFILFFVFLLCALAVIVIGSNVYQTTTQNMNENFSSKTALNYILERTRQMDRLDSRQVIEIDGVTVLQLRQQVEDSYFDTLIYEYQGNLMEMFVRAETSITFSAGTIIMEDISLTFESPMPHLIVVSLTDSQRNVGQIAIAERSRL